MNRELDLIDTYCDTVPRVTAHVEQIAGFTLFIGTVGQQFYARPDRGLTGSSTAEAIAVVRDRQRELGIPESFEWIDGLHPGLAAIAEAAGLEVHHHPLMVQRELSDESVPPGFTMAVLSAEDPMLPTVLAAIGLGFHSPGTAVSPVGSTERDALVAAVTDGDDRAQDGVRDAIRNGWTAIAAVSDGSGPVAGGSHSIRGPVAEITGLATLPVYRRRGIGAALTAGLCADATGRGAQIRFLSAESDDVARIYARCGFVRIGTACVAEPASA